MTMTKQQEFLDTLINPVRARIKKNINKFFRSIQGPDIVRTESIGEEGRYNLYVTARNRNVYDVTVEHFLDVYFPRSGDYEVSKAFGGPNLRQVCPTEYLMMYYIVETSCYD